MSLMGRIQKARAERGIEVTGEIQVRLLDTQGREVTTSPWVKQASEGARIGRPLNGRGLPVRAEASRG